MSTPLEKTNLANELRFALKVREALEDSANAIPPERLEQLGAARKAALRAQKSGSPVLQWSNQPAFAGAAAVASRQSPGWLRTGFALGLVLLVGTCIAGIFSIEQERRIDELADIDAALLSDEIPLSAYADHGFNAYIKQNP
jgi:hypothetical protein